MSFSKLVASSISLGIQLISFFTGTSRLSACLRRQRLPLHLQCAPSTF